MIKTIVKIDGMMCGMCESHVNDKIRNSFKVNSVKSSHSKGESVILTESKLNEADLRAAIEETEGTFRYFRKVKRHENSYVYSHGYTYRGNVTACQPHGCTKKQEHRYGRGAEMSGISSRTGDAKANGRETAMPSFSA